MSVVVQQLRSIQFGSKVPGTEGGLVLPPGVGPPLPPGLAMPAWLGSGVRGSLFSVAAALRWRPPHSNLILIRSCVRHTRPGRWDPSPGGLGAGRAGCRDFGAVRLVCQLQALVEQPIRKVGDTVGHCRARLTCAGAPSAFGIASCEHQGRPCTGAPAQPPGWHGSDQDQSRISRPLNAQQAISSFESHESCKFSARGGRRQGGVGGDSGSASWARLPGGVPQPPPGQLVRPEPREPMPRVCDPAQPIQP